jgi:DNA mismatch repair ATPase MutS
LNAIRRYLFKLRWGKELKKRRLVRDIWRGRTGNEQDMDLISSLYRLNPVGDDLVDERTWTDLEMDRLFARMNRTITLLGSQFLYRQFRTAQSDSKELDHLHDLIINLKNDRRLRERLQMALLPLRKLDADLSALFAGAWEKPPRFARWMPLYPWLFAGIVTAAALFQPKLWFLVAAMMALSWVMRLSLFARISCKIPDCIQLVRMLNLSSQLAKWEYPVIREELQKCRAHRKVAKMTVKKLFWMTVDSSDYDEMSSLVIRYIQAFLMTDIIAYFRLINFVGRYAAVWRELFETVAHLDSALALAAFTESYPIMTRVKWLNNPMIEAEGLYHPLIDNAVPNDLNLEQKSLLITGSNMSGKTTFIKTVGVNLILARAFGLACAVHFGAAPFTIFSAISTAESLDGAKSYYYREIERILALIGQNPDKGPYLFLIDELFRGTNTAERLAAAVAVLENLSKKGMVMVTTHDVELESRLREDFAMVHFREEIKEGVHFFDYRIHQGPCRSRNAIRLLQLIGYPPQLVQRAMDLLGMRDSSFNPE